MILKILKYFLYFILALGIVLFTSFLILDEDIPEGESGAEAEKLADKMLLALNKSAWDTISTISWSYPPNHHYTWFKNKDSVIVSWEDYEVRLNTSDRKGKVFKDGEAIEDKDADIQQKAISYFFNDSFWLIAPYKLRDPGTIRKLVDFEGEEALLVTYTSGGVTPGDSYLWILDDNGRPKAWKFWVSVLPIGGIKFTWEEWKNLNGAQISTLHSGLINIEVSNLRLGK